MKPKLTEMYDEYIAAREVLLFELKQQQQLLERGRGLSAETDAMIDKQNRIMFDLEGLVS